MHWRINLDLRRRVALRRFCAFFHAGGASMNEGKARAAFDVETEFSHRSAVLRALGPGKLQNWHLLDEAQRAQVRADPAYSHIGATAP